MCCVFTFLASEYDCLDYLNGRIQCEHFELADMLTTNVNASTSGSFTMIGSDLHAGIDFVNHECLDFPECIREHEGELTVVGSEYMVPNEWQVVDMEDNCPVHCSTNITTAKL